MGSSQPMTAKGDRMASEPKIRQNRGNAGKGRPKGAPNKLTATIKGAIESAFDKVGGADYLARMAEEQPVAFMSLLGKVLPTQVDATIAAKMLPTSVDDLI